MNKSYILIVFILLFGANISAVQANQWLLNKKISVLSNWVGGGANPNEIMLVKLHGIINGPIYNPAGCQKDDWFALDSDASEISRSILLAASINGQQVDLALSPSVCTSDNRPKIINVTIE